MSQYGENTSPFGFEDLEVYKAARGFRVRIYKLAKMLPSEEKFTLVQQMRRAAVSLTCNIAEGYGAGTTGRKIRSSADTPEDHFWN